MQKKKTKKGEQVESLYAARQRRRAEKIIQATGCYSAAFRNEVQQALDKLPHKLPVLFREADRIHERLESAGRSIRAEMRKAGSPIGEPTLKRSPKNCAVRDAEEVESVLMQYEADELNEEMAERAQLISDILYDLGNEANVYATHPQLVKAYVLALGDALRSVERRSTYESIQTAFQQVRDLINGCSEARFEEINKIYNGDQKERDEARRKAFPDWDQPTTPAPEVVEPEVNNEMKVALREQLAQLEELPENEAIAFQLESKIYSLEHQADNGGWPDVIGA